MTTTERLLGLLSLLQTRRDWPGSLLASRLAVSDRTVRRDIDRLRGMGYRIQATMGPDGGYRLDAGDELPPLLFDDDQALAVAIALRTAPAAGAGIEEAALRALGTMRHLMPSRLRHRLDALEVRVIRRPGDGAPVDSSLAVLVTLAQVIRDRQTLRFDYAPHVGGEEPWAPAPPARRVEPHHLVTSHGRWYLVAWDLDVSQWRLFRVDRVQPRVPHGPLFAPRTVPGGDVDAFVSARFRGSDVNAWPCRGTVLLHLPARDVLPFAGDGTVTPVDEHTCTLEAGSWSWGALAASFGQFDVPMEVIGPDELVAAFRTLSERYGAGEISPGFVVVPAESSHERRELRDAGEQHEDDVSHDPSGDVPHEVIDVCDVTTVEELVREELGKLDPRADSSCGREHLPPGRAAQEERDEDAEGQEDGDVRERIIGPVVIERNQRDVRKAEMPAGCRKEKDREDSVGNDACGVDRDDCGDQHTRPGERGAPSEDEKHDDEHHETQGDHDGENGDASEGA